MEFSFLHIADAHLGFRQYGLRERYNDFAQALNWAVQEAVKRQVDFVLLAGDLFHKRSYVLPFTVRQMIQILTPLKRDQIPCLAIEGNHDKPFYADGHMSWVEFLAEQGMLQLLNFLPDHEGPLRPASAPSPVGHFSEPLPGVRVYGMGYKGAGTQSALFTLAQALEDSPREDVHYSVLALHTGLEGEIPANVTGTITVGDLAPLQPHVDYLALGHYHKPFAYEGWIYNPGSLEVTSIDVWDDQNPGGAKLVEVNTAAQPAHRVTHLPSPIRPWVRHFFQVNKAESPEHLQQGLLESLDSQLRPESRGDDRAPLLHIMLWGRLDFPSHLLDLNQIREAVLAQLQPLECRIHLQAQTSQGEEQSPADHRTLHDIEQEVLLDTIREHPQYADSAALWRSATQELMAHALAHAAPEELYATLSAYDDAAQAKDD